METFLLVGSVWFWIFFTIWLIATAILVEWNDDDVNSGTAATAIFTIFLVLLYFMGNKSLFREVFDYMRTNPGIVISGALIYLGAGTVWSIGKWYFFLKKKKEFWGKQSFKSQFKDGKYDVSKNSGMLIRWMSYWPLSLAWTTIDQPVKRMFALILERLNGVYAKIAKNIAEDEN